VESKKLVKKQRALRFMFQLNEELHRELKIAAALRNMSMSLILHKAIYQYLRRGDKDESKLDIS